MTINASKKIVFMDCETTSLRPDRRAWEIGMIDVPDLADPTKDIEYSIFISEEGLDLGNADPIALKVGGFYERHPSQPDVAFPHRPGAYMDEGDALFRVVRVTVDAVIHGSNPAFDMATLEPRIRAHDMLPRWHYHPRDVPDFLRGALIEAKSFDLYATSDDISRAYGVEPATFERHTALGDCRWQLALYRKVLGLPITIE